MRTWEQEWFRTEEAFPRESMLNRLLTNTYDEFDAIRRQNLYVDIYSSLFSTEQLIDDRLDTFFFDVDGTVREAFNKMQHVLRRIVMALEYTPRIYCSGRGYHVFVDVEPIDSKHWRELNNWLIDGLGIRAFVDRALIGNPRALARFPGTRNSKTGWWMARIDPLDSFDKAVHRAQTNRQDGEILAEADKPLSVDTLISRLRAFAGPQTNAVPERVTISSIMPNGHNEGRFEGFPPCIEAILKEIDISGECDHERRVFLASVLTKVEDIDASIRRFEKAGDFDYNTTRYQLEHIKNKGYTPARCNTVQTWGICPGDCRYYPSIGRSLPDRHIELRDMGLERH